MKPFSIASSVLLALCSSSVTSADLFNQATPDGRPLLSSFFGIPGTNATYDYVIVGGGTAGLALASRLAAANISVAVLEAGGFYETDNGNLSIVPGSATYYTGSNPDNFQPLIDWGISTVPQPVGLRCSARFVCILIFMEGVRQPKCALRARQDSWRILCKELFPLPASNGTKHG